MLEYALTTAFVEFDNYSTFTGHVSLFSESYRAVTSHHFLIRLFYTNIRGWFDDAVKSKNQT